jgi:hypothetical protein
MKVFCHPSFDRLNSCSLMHECRWSLTYVQLSDPIDDKIVARLAR